MKKMFLIPTKRLSFLLALLIICTFIFSSCNSGNSEKKALTIKAPSGEITLKATDTDVAKFESLCKAQKITTADGECFNITPEYFKGVDIRIFKDGGKSSYILYDNKIYKTDSVIIGSALADINSDGFYELYFSEYNVNNYFFRTFDTADRKITTLKENIGCPAYPVKQSDENGLYLKNCTVNGYNRYKNIEDASADNVKEQAAVFAKDMVIKPLETIGMAAYDGTSLVMVNDKDFAIPTISTDENLQETENTDENSSNEALTELFTVIESASGKIIAKNEILEKHNFEKTNFGNLTEITVTDAAKYTSGDFISVTYRKTEDKSLEAWTGKLYGKACAGVISLQIKAEKTSKIIPAKTKTTTYAAICEIKNDSFICSESSLDDINLTQMYIVKAKIDSNYKVGDYVEITYYANIYSSDYMRCIYDEEYDKALLWTGKIGSKNYIGSIKAKYTALSVAPVSKNAFNEYLSSHSALTGKPVIYLYPEKTEKVNVKLDYAGTLVHSFPVYNSSGWTVTAQPDGTLTDKNGEYPYLFWDGNDNAEYDFSKGFCVKGSNSRAFLEKTLLQIGLNEDESQAFISYWLPSLMANEYNVVSFQTTAYTDIAKLEINPKPDSELRVFMAFKASDKPVSVAPQQFSSFERNGFCVVEWGGSFVK